LEDRGVGVRVEKFFDAGLELVDLGAQADEHVDVGQDDRRTFVAVVGRCFGCARNRV
jgi:hypothetical protein